MYDSRLNILQSHSYRHSIKYGMLIDQNTIQCINKFKENVEKMHIVNKSQ